MTGEPLLILGALTAALEAAQVAFLNNRPVNGLLGAAIAGCTFLLGRGKVTPTRQDGLP